MFPRALAVNVVLRHGQIGHFWRWRMYLERHDLLPLQAYFADVTVRVVNVA